MRISHSGPMQPMQPMQRAAAQPKANETPQTPKSPSPPTTKDENKTQNFSDTPLRDVSSPFSGKTTGSAEQMASLMAAEEELLEELEEEDTDGPDALQELDASEESDELEETEESAEAEEAEEAEELDTEPKNTEEEEQGGLEDGEAGGQEEASTQINLASILELVPELRNAERFRIEETWALFAGQ